MEPAGKFLCGIVEGYYGRSWPHETRLAYAGYLARAGLNACLYCPKEDPYLRRRWQERWPEPQWLQLRELATAYRQRGIDWGVGLSPFELYRDYGPAPRRQLRDKIRSLAELEAPLLAILFDDMPGDLDALASRQAAIVDDVLDWLPGVRVLVCPTYYSFDPVLEKHFGRMPQDYWPQLGREMPGQVDIFWTGNRVCSDQVTAADITAITHLLNRPVMLWDNYPVNDGAVRSNFLYCSALSGRDPELRGLLSGHLCNPMNQALLSLPALAGLAALYSGDPPDRQWLPELIGPATWARLQVDGRDFQQLGLSGLGEARRRELAASYGALGEPAATEISAWLRGEYTFDPACLTD